MTGHDGTAKASQGAISRWANRYGWAVKHERALMLQIVSNDTVTHLETACTNWHQAISSNT